MTPWQRAWSEARDRLAAALKENGFPAETADLLARELKSPKAIDRMASYIRAARPRSMEMLADEMLAICAEIDAWHEKKSSMEAQAAYNRRLFYSRGGGEDGE